MPAQDCSEERDTLTDGEIEISINRVRPEAPVWWRWACADEWQGLPFQTADLNPSDEYALRTVRDWLAIDDEA